MWVIQQWAVQWSQEKEEKKSWDAKLHETWTPPTPFATRPLDHPQYCGEAAVDIIAVHGLDSDHERGWSNKLSDGTQYPWLRKKLPNDMPDARILSFSYPSSFYGDPTYTSLEECGRQLLREIIRDRRHPGRLRMCPTRKKRPVIFLGHSFGGLVIKQALLRANEYISDKELQGTPEGKRERQNYQDILSAVGGLFFLGTPHKGSHFSKWAEVKMFLGSLCGQATYPELVKLLQTHSLDLLLMQRDFKRLYMQDKLFDVPIYCYWEKRGVALYPHIVVSKKSACISGAECRGLDATHKELNKFKEGEDENYKQVLEDLIHALGNSAVRISKTFTPGNYGSAFPSAERKAVRRGLKSADGPQLARLKNQLSQRRSTPSSCRWILGHLDFTRWTSHFQDLDVLWIHGKGGAGKSVLAAYIVDWLRADFGRVDRAHFDEFGFPVCRLSKSQNLCGYTKQRNTVLYFFFGINRSNESVTSFLGTMVQQLLSIYYDNGRLFAMAKAFVMNQVQNQISMQDEEGDLIKLLVEMISQLGTAFIIVDGVEENNENQQGVSCLKALGCLRAKLPARQLKILILSQITNPITVAISESLPDRAEMDICSFTRDDISDFIHTRGDELVKKKPHLEDGKEKILQSLTDGAQGMFQWVIGAIDLVEQYVGDVKNIDDCLADLPINLTKTYEKILLRLPTGNEALQIQKRIRLALRLLTVSARPISVAELWYAYTMGTTEDIGKRVKTLLQEKEEFKDAKVASKEILGLLDSLVEFDVENGLVQLSHHSIRSALLKTDDSPVKNLTVEQSRIAAYQFTELEAHGQMAELCMRICQNSTFAHATAFAPSQIPFVHYSWDHWTYHLKRSSGKLNTVFDQMIKGISRDTISFLGALTEFVARPLVPVPGRYSDLEYIMSLKRAQESLLPAIEPLTVIQREPLNGISTSLLRHQDLVAALDESVGIQQTMLQYCQDFTKHRYKKLGELFRPKETTVTRLRVDGIVDKRPFTQLPQMPPASNALFEAARNLRAVTLRFAVNPVYSALISCAGGMSFSPIHLLVYVASHLEECGSYPFWENLPSNWDPVDPFICNEDDPQSGPARFVLHCFEWREQQEDQANANPLSNRQYTRAARRINQPNPEVRQLQRVSTANKEQVKRLHGMTGGQYWTSQALLGLFAVSDNIMTQLLVYNPIGQHHVRSNLLLNENGSYFDDPRETLARHAPESIMETPLHEMLDAVPDLLRLYFVKYVAIVYEHFGRVAASALAVHVNQMNMVYMCLKKSWHYCKMMYNSGNRFLWWHIFLALFLFWLRNRYLPWVAAHHLDNPLERFRLSYTDPVSYLQSQNSFSWWYWAKTLLTAGVFDSVLNQLLAFGVRIKKFFDQLRTSFPAHAVYVQAAELGFMSFTTFMHFCNLHRHACTALYLLGTVVSSGYIMMRDQGSILAIFTFTFWYWFGSLLGLLNGVAIVASLEGFGFWGLLAYFVLLVPQCYGFKLLLQYEAAIERVLSWPFRPLLWLAKLCWISFLKTYVHILKVFGMLVLIGLTLRAFFWLQKTTYDPYDVEGSVKKLCQAAELAKLTLKESEMRHIGQYPLGGEIEERPDEQPASEETNSTPPTPETTPPNPTDNPESNEQHMNGHARQPGSAPAATPPPNASKSKHLTRAAASGVHVARDRRQEMDSFASGFNRTDVKRRFQRGFAMAMQ